MKNPEEDEIYCICKKIQEGEMIECEDKTVGKKWEIIDSADWFGTISRVWDWIKCLMDNGSVQNVSKSRRINN